MSSDASATPEVLWAQRSSSTDPSRNFIYLTISVPDVPASSLKLELNPQSLTFEGRSETLRRTYKLQFEFYGVIDKAESQIHHTAKNVEMKIRKKELDDAYWPRLLNDSKKVHFLKTDFDKWVDEDDQVDSPDDDFANYGGMSGMEGVAGMPGMGSDFGGMDFSKLGADGGMGDDSDDDLPIDDEEMPGLEGEDEASSAKDKRPADAPAATQATAEAATDSGKEAIEEQSAKEKEPAA